MSTAWKGPVVLLREPASALFSRLGYRLLLAILAAAAAWIAPWAFLAVIGWIVAAVMGMLALLAIANVVLNRRVLLRLTGAGSIEWPQSIQERVLRRPLDWVAAPTIEVVYPPVAALPGNADPRISLSDGERSIERVPLYGVSPEDFVAAANAALVGRGVTLRYTPPDAVETSVGEVE